MLRVVRQTSMTPPPTVPALRKTNAVPPPPPREAVPGPMLPMPIAPPGPLQPPPPAEAPRAVVFEGTEELRIAATIPPTPPRRRRASDPPAPPPVAEPQPAFDPSGLRLNAAPEQQVMDVASREDPQVDIIPNRPAPSAPVPIRPASIAPPATADETADDTPSEDGVKALLKNPVNLVLISLAVLLFLAFLLLKIGVI